MLMQDGSASDRVQIGFEVVFDLIVQSLSILALKKLCTNFQMRRISFGVGSL